MADRDEVASAAQDAWVEIAASMRELLAKRVMASATLTTCEFESLAKVAKELFWLDVLASGFDHEIRLKLQQSYFDT
jgi:hypothetical protein